MRVIVLLSLIYERVRKRDLCAFVILSDTFEGCYNLTSPRMLIQYDFNNFLQLIFLVIFHISNASVALFGNSFIRFAETRYDCFEFV